MVRVWEIGAVLTAIAAAFWLYAVGYDTRRLEADVTLAERQRDRLQNDIAVLEAERAYLARPSRIEPLARQQGLRPAGPEQFAPAAVR